MVGPVIEEKMQIFIVLLCKCHDALGCKESWCGRNL